MVATRRWAGAVPAPPGRLPGDGSVAVRGASGDGAAGSATGAAGGGGTGWATGAAGGRGSAASCSKLWIRASTIWSCSWNSSTKSPSTLAVLRITPVSTSVIWAVMRSRSPIRWKPPWTIRREAAAGGYVSHRLVWLDDDDRQGVDLLEVGHDGVGDTHAEPVVVRVTGDVGEPQDGDRLPLG